MEEQKISCISHERKSMPSPYQWAAKLKDGVYHFSFPDCLSWLNASGKRLFEDNFTIHPEDKRVIYQLLVYAIGDEIACKKHRIQLGKGILLTGPLGCGKTTLMLLLNSFFPPNRRYQIKSSRELSFEFEKQGYQLIHQYGNHLEYAEGSRFKSGIYCFDDLGVEQPQKFYGNECNVMAEILLSRHELFLKRRILTHATTHLSEPDLEAYYGKRVSSRMRELFNLIAFDENSKDKRK